MVEIRIRRLVLDVRLGAYEEERSVAQQVTADIQMQADVDKACISDKLEDTIDYSVLANEIQTLIRKTEFNLIERLATFIADRCMEFDRRIKSVEVLVEKPGALPGIAENTSAKVCKESER